MDIDVKKIKGLIFDLDGTLADTMPLHLEAWNEVGTRHGLALSPQDNQDTAGMATEEIVRHFNKERNLNVDPEQFAIEKENFFINEKLPQVQAYKPIAAFICELHGKMPLAIGTGSTRDLTNKVLHNLKLTDYITAIATADDVKNYKPAPDTFLKAAKDMNIAAENCLVFEDSKLGIKAAISGGMQAVDVLETTEEELAALLKALKEHN